MTTAASKLLPRIIGVVGAGQMGAGIAQVASTKGLSVTLVDPDPRALSRGLTNIGRSLDRLVKRGGLLSRAEADEALERVKGAESLEALSEAELVVEAVSENEALKKSIFATLDRVAPPAAILASNTSSISITRIAAATQRPGNVVGMHFMNPVPLMPLVELVRGIATTDETFSTATRLAEHLGKTVTHSADRPGFTVNRILMPSINEAFFCLMEGVASAEDIDRGMKLGTNQPLGPLALADFIGLDTCLSILKVMAETDPRFIPCVLLQQYVDAGWTGKKAFRGVYKYAEPLN